MERLTQKERNSNGTAISKKSMIDREEYPTLSDYALKVLTKLADYEDAEEQGMLLRLPCKVGDTVYLIKNDGTIAERVADMMFIGVLWKEFGKTVFLTRSEAEAKLAEMEGAE